MQLKKLEIYGFKSFADKTVIEFPTGITAIVGPNGSGKSNVVDAIRWVLGEQSAKELRGEKVGDFIFNGSNTRHRLGYTQVSLTLDNSDGYLATEFSEVTITRKAYRTGESEYYINKSRCRLKDIQELFLDTGLGRYSFAVISQGQIESLIEARPAERRQIFDDACGINKYKAKKEETLRKLERTEIDLARATDIAMELESRIEPLKAAKENAEKFLELKGQLESAREKLVLSEYLEYWKAFSAKQEEKVQAENVVVDLTARLSQFEASEAKLKSEYDRIEDRLSANQSDLFGLEQSLQEIAGDLRVIRERQGNFRDKNRQVKGTIQSLNLQLQEQKEKLRNADAREKELEDQLDALKKALSEKQAELDRYLQSKEEHQQAIEKTKDEVFSLAHEISEKNNEKSRLEKDLDLIDTLIAREDAAAGAAEGEKELLCREKSNLEEEIRALRSAISELENAISAGEKELSAANENLRHETQLYEAKKEKLREKSARYKALCATEEDLVGYQAGVRAVLKAEIPGVLGVIAKMIKVEDRFTKAVEAVLGAQLQGVVTATDQDAQKAIEYLHSQKAGKATFYPLNLLDARTIPESDQHLKSLKGVLGLLADFIDFAPPYDKDRSFLQILAEFLGGRTFVADNLENARALAKACRTRYRIVTLAGEVIWTGGTMTGGEDKQERIGLLQRQAVTRNLEAEIKAETEALEKDRKNLENLKAEVEKKSQELTELHDLIRSKTTGLEALRANSTALDEKIAAADLRLQSSLQEKKRLEEQALEVKAQLKQVEESIAKLEEEQRVLKIRLSELGQMEWTEEAGIREQYQNLKEQETIAKERVLASRRSRDELVLAINQTEDLIAAQHRELEQIMLAEVRERLNALNKSKLRLVLLFQSEMVRKVIKGLKDEKASVLEKLNAFEVEIAKLRPEISKAETYLRDVTVAYAKLESQIENCQQKAEELGIALEKASDEHAIPIQERNKLNQVVRKLDREIASLGVVNVGAIEEYKEVSERYQFLSTQINDLTCAKDDLMEVLAQLDRQSREKFLEAFNEIKVEFEKLFKHLFGGGQATLLLEEGDVLEAGIEIKAQPPGKKLQSIALLSGGEKTLTAIALVFAAVSVRNVPFYLFDEVDASLDEANLVRFINLVKEKAEKAQIILITHRRRSMEEANLLYGVTMEEKGVSKVLALHLEDQAAAAMYESI